ncbi:hypothetical protein ACFLQ1_02240 [Candidatus Auribacterota bacterium]
MAIKPIKKISFFFLLFFSFFFTASSFSLAAPIQIIKELFKDAKKGEWVLTQSKKGYQNKTTVLKRQENLLILEIQNIIKGKVESKTVQEIDLNTNQITKAEIISEEDEIIKIPVKNIFFNSVKITKYAQIKKETIKVPAGTFICRVYKTIANDKVGYLWLNDTVPVNHIVKAKIKHTVVKLIDFGKKEERKEKKLEKTEKLLSKSVAKAS